MTEITDRDYALFEAGIKLGAMYHQFVGSPVNIDTAESLECAISASIALQPYVQTIAVFIDRGMIRTNLNEFGYCELEGKMLNVDAVIEYKTAVVHVGMGYDERIGYPLMYVQQIEDI